MDLRAEAQRLILDVLAVECCDALRQAGIPHALLKGPSTSLWLYKPPRLYSDVDLLVPWGRYRDAVECLETAGLAASTSYSLDMDADHSCVMRTTAGYEIDLHVSLPTVPPQEGRVWTALAGHLEPLDLGIGIVPALDEAARCLVLALHALNNVSHLNQSAEDLRRARAYSSDDAWAAAQHLAGRLDAEDLFLAGLSIVEPGGAATASTRASLRLNQAPQEAIVLQRLLDPHTHGRLGLLWRELVPPRSFLSRTDSPPSRFGTAHLYLRRWRILAAKLPRALRSLRRAHR